MLLPGDIVTSFTIEQEDSQGHVHIVDNQNNRVEVVGIEKGRRGRLHPEKIKAMQRENQTPIPIYILDSRLNRSTDDKEPPETTYIGTPHRGYAFEQLKDLLYFDKENLDQQKIFFNRFREAVNLDTSNIIKISEPKNSGEVNGLYPQRWRLIEKKSEWILPALTAARWKTFDTLETDELFPNLDVLNAKTAKDRRKITCYSRTCCDLPYHFSGLFKRESNNTTLGSKLFEALVQNSSLGKLQREVTIVFHGFTLPEYWHYKVWKHVFAATPSKIDEHWESKIWQNKMNTSDPDPTIFNLCQEHKNQRCKKCENGEFQIVNKNITPFMTEYLTKFVTFFLDEDTVKTMVVKTEDNSEIKHIEIDCDGTESHDGKTLYPTMGLAGICLNWDTQKEPILIHVRAKTYHYRTKAKSRNYKRAIIGKITNLSRSNNV